MEHENSKADWLDEVIKLEHLKCPLKVVIEYNYCDMRGEEEIERLNVTARWMKVIAAYDANSKEEFLIISGNGEAKKDKAIKCDKFDYRGYLYNFGTGEFYRIYPEDGCSHSHFSFFFANVSISAHSSALAGTAKNTIMIILTRGCLI